MCTALNEMIKEGEKRGERRGEKRGIRKGKAESILMLLKDLGTVPAELSKKIMDETDLDSLNRWLKQAAYADSVAQFQAEMGNFLAGFVNSEKIYRLSEQKGEFAMCTALNEMIEEGEKRGERRGEKRGEKRGIRKGKAESILMLLKDLGTVPAELSKKIMDETDLDSLNRWLKQAACADSVAQFQAEMGINR